MNQLTLAGAAHERMHLTSFARMIRTAFASALSFLIWVSPTASRQQAANGPTGQSIKVTSVAVNIYAIAEGRHGRLIRDLQKDDFELTEDAAPQKIEYFSQETSAALSLGVAIDTSVSQGHLLGTEQAAAKKFLRSVLQSGDQAFVMNFDVDVKLLKDFTDAATELARAIDSCLAGTTSLRSRRARASIRASYATSSRHSGAATVRCWSSGSRRTRSCGT